MNSVGNVCVGAPGQENALVLYDTANGQAYGLRVTNGELVLGAP
jgi:hypothetical protein